MKKIFLAALFISVMAFGMNSFAGTPGVIIPDSVKESMGTHPGPLGLNVRPMAPGPQIMASAGEAKTVMVDDIAVPAEATVVVTLKCGKNDSAGILKLFKKTEAEDGSVSFKQILVSNATLGKNGLYKEKEGDNKTPVGVFKMNTPMGIKSALSGFPENYLKVNDTHYWNGDSVSSRYNKLVSTDDYSNFRTSESEHIVDYPGYYNYCIDSGYNYDGEPYRGSAIFLHCQVDGQTTHGCIAIPENDMIEVMRNYAEGSTYMAIAEK
ncbi:MAG: L,D-transpeptidase family protein [Eubacteriales bacterium]|nr:L,D-transpeptidase family protein [Eubacteriales bacterium]